MLRDFNPQEALNSEKQTLNTTKQEAEAGRRLLEEVRDVNLPTLPERNAITNYQLPSLDIVDTTRNAKALDVKVAPNPTDQIPQTPGPRQEDSRTVTDVFGNSIGSGWAVNEKGASVHLSGDSATGESVVAVIGRYPQQDEARVWVTNREGNSTVGRVMRSEDGIHADVTSIPNRGQPKSFGF